MCVTSFNPYDSDTWPDDEEIMEINQNMERSISAPAPPMPPAVLPQEEESTESDTDYTQEDAELLFCQTCPGDSSIILTQLDKLRAVLATKTGHPGGQLSNTTKMFPGFIAVPLGAVGMFRYPKNRHKHNCNVFVYCPTTPQDIQTTAAQNPDLNNIANLVNN